jgi:hypothetical protein
VASGIVQQTSGGINHFRNLRIKNQGLHGLWNKYGNSSAYYDIDFQTNGGDGLRFSEGNDKNACSCFHIRSDSNGGNGVYMGGLANSIFGLKCSGNTGYDLYFANDHNSVYGFYSEGNSGGGSGGIYFSDTSASNVVLGGEWEMADVLDESTAKSNAYILFGSPAGGLFNAGVGADLRAGKHSYSSARFITWGADSPEGVVTASVGAIYLRTNGSTTTTLYVKTSGTGNTGWTAK